MVTPTYGALYLRGVNSGKSYVAGFYISDVVGAPLQWDNGSGASATSGAFYKIPERCVAYDCQVTTGPTVMTNFVLTADGGQIPGARLRISGFLDTLATRPTLAIGFNQGTNLGAIQA